VNVARRITPPQTFAAACVLHICALGRLAGLLGGSAVLLHLLPLALVSRLPWLEASVGCDWLYAVDELARKRLTTWELKCSQCRIEVGWEAGSPNNRDMNRGDHRLVWNAILIGRRSSPETNEPATRGAIDAGPPSAEGRQSS
jgi:hypothetical protein